MLHKEITSCVESWIERSPEWYIEAMKFYKTNYIHLDVPVGLGSNKKDLTIDLKPFLCQIWEGRKMTFIDNVICGAIWQWILSGDIKYIVQETPPCFSDKEKKENDELVKSYIQCVKTEKDYKIISAEFYGGTQGEDGFIDFDKPPIHIAKSFPLEIGYCQATQFLSLMLCRKKIARLPYGQNHIIYFEFVSNRFDINC